MDLTCHLLFPSPNCSPGRDSSFRGASKTLSMVAVPIFPGALDRLQHRTELGFLSLGLNGDTLVPQWDPSLRVSLPGWVRAEHGSSRVIFDTSVRGNIQNCVSCRWSFTLRTMGQRGRFSKILLKKQNRSIILKTQVDFSPPPSMLTGPSLARLHLDGSEAQSLLLSSPLHPISWQLSLHIFLQFLICLL